MLEFVEGSREVPVVISSLEDLFDVIAERVADRIAARDASLINQRDRRGLLGRRHIDAVRRRMAEKTGDAFHWGRDYLLTPAAVRAELERGGMDAENDNTGPERPRKTSAKTEEELELARLKRELETDMLAARRGTKGRK